MSAVSWHNRQPFTVTAEMIGRPWCGYRDGRAFRCALCGRRFVAGDAARWIFTNDGKGQSGNPFVCSKCDGTDEDVRARLQQLIDDANADRMWWPIFSGHSKHVREHE